MAEEKVLFTLNEVCEYLGIGQTTARKLFATCKWSMKIGNKWYAHKKKLDRWLESQTEKSNWN